MSGHTTAFRAIRGRLRTTVAALAIAAIPPGTALAQEAPVAAPTQIEETNRYQMRLMTQIFDGSREFSHTQTAGFARMRKGDESWVMLDFGDGAVVIEKGGRTAVGGFRNISDVEAGMRYDYATRTLSGGDPRVAAYHNDFVRPQLGRGPALGANGAWTANMTLAQLGFAQLGAQALSIELRREYFSHGGQDYVLLHYRVPSFTYTAGGRRIVQWGEGIAVTDPGFGQMYWNATLHRAVASQNGETSRPYRFTKTIAATDDKGEALIDPRKMVPVAAHYARFYGHSNDEVMGFVGDGVGSDQLPIDISAKLDIMALSMAEDSANQLGEVTSSYTNGSRGNETPTPNPLAGVGGAEGGALDTADKVATIAGAISELTAKGNDLGSQLVGLKAQYDAAQRALDAIPAAEAVQSTLKPSTIAATNALTRTMGELDSFEAVFSDLARTNTKPAPGLVAQYEQVKAQAVAERARIDDLYRTGEAYDVKTSAKAEAILDNARQKLSLIQQLEGELGPLGEKAAEISRQIKALGATGVVDLLKKFGDSPYGKTLAGVTDFLDALTVAEAGYNVVSASTTNLGAGQQLPLTRNYDGAGRWGTLGLELAALAADASVGNIRGFAFGAAALTTGSIGDVFIATKALADTNRIVEQAAWQTKRLETDASIRRTDNAFGELRTVLAETKQDLEDLPKDLEDGRKLAASILEERRRNRERAEAEAKAAAKAESDRLVAAARAENERIYRENLKRPPTAAELAKFNRDIADAIKPDYPTAPPPSAADIAARLARIAAQQREATRQAQLAEADAIRAAAKTAAAKLAAQQELARVQREAVAKREQERQDRRDRNDEAERRGLDVSKLDFEPVTFDPVDFVPPEFDPPKFVPPDFKPPKPTNIPFTNFDDDDWLSSDPNNLAFQFENMSGRVATDLSRYAEFLKTQNVRELERLAKAAGYPHLASGLNNAGYILQKSQDEGFRRHAREAPACGGYIGCAPNYLGTWDMKTALVALGDILNTSRDIFSTGGLSDIGISGLNLAYLLRDFGVQDGDTVNIKISQFGKTIFTNNNFILTNGGNNFNINLRPGVAALEIFAVNEGSLRPNTAEITIENVTEGESRQQYSLSQSEFATLRIAINRPRLGN